MANITNFLSCYS